MSSATSAATASHSSQTAPIGFSITSSIAAAASSAASSASSSGAGGSSGAASLGLGREHFLGMGVAVAGVVLGGAFTLF